MEVVVTDFVQAVEPHLQPKTPYTTTNYQGANSCGQLGQQRKCEECVKPSQAPLDHLELEPADISCIVAGASHSFLLSKSGVVYGCGSNAHGQLADASKEETIFKAIPALTYKKINQLATKWDSSYAVTSDNVCLAWGQNNFGQLGCSTKNYSIDSPQVILSNVKQVAAGLRHVLILHNDGSVSSAGDGKRGQLGYPASSSDLKKINGLEGVVQVACGQNHNLGLTGDGKVLGWGCNKFRQLAVGNQDIVREPTMLCEVESTKCKLLCGWTHAAILDDKGKLFNWGRNKYGQLGVNPSPFQDKPQEFKFKPFLDVECGSEHTVGITINRELVCWGWNEHGNCGTGDTTDIIPPTTIDVGEVLKIGAGAGQSFAVVESNKS